MATPLNIVSTFSGVGGLDAGLGLALDELGIEHRTKLFVERDAAAARILAQRAEEGSLGPLAPGWGIWSDVRNIPDIGGADILCGGFPCQDISSAGKGAGIAGGARSGLWFDMLAAAVRLGCRYIFAENVGQITTRGLDLVLGSLAEVGFDEAEWCHLSLAQLGFPQKRERWFLLANARDIPGEVPQASPAGDSGGRTLASAGGAGDSEGVADADQPGSQGRRVSGPGCADERAAWQECGAVGSLPICPPGPDDGEWEIVLESYPELAPAIESPIRGVATGAPAGLDIPRTDRLRALGNLATPAQSYAAFLHLWRRTHGGA